MARKVIAEFDAIDGPFINKLNAINNSVSRFEAGTLSAFGRVEKGMNGLLASAARLQNVSGIIAGGFGVQMAANYVDQATRIRRALTEAGDSSQAAFEKAFLASQRSLAGFEAFSQGVARMRKATGGSFDDSVRNMETLNKLLVLGGKTTQERMSTMIQFSQALQAGVLQGEELRSLRENAPIELVRAIAREAGGTIEDLKDFGAAGVLTTEVMIRALKSLEAEADIRMRNVTLTISEAATTLASAGIVAAEAFDRGLGLGRAAVAGLTGLANILGSNAEAAELFGQAVKVAAAVGLTSFAGRQMNSAIANTRAYGDALRVAAQSAKLAESAAATAVVNTAIRERAIRKEIAAMRDRGAAQSTLQRAYARLDQATVASAAAVTRYKLAADAATAANARLSLSFRATAAAGNLMRGAFAFLGGWPGIILTAGIALATVASNAESAAEKFERLTSDTGTASSAADALLNVQGLLNEAMAAAGVASDEASRKIVANTMQELAAKRTLLELEQGALLTAQEERRKLIDQLESERAAIPTMADRQAGIEGDLLGVFPQGSMEAQEAFQERITMAQQEYNAELQVATNKIREMESAYILAGGQIDRNNLLLGSTATQIATATLQSFGLSDGLTSSFNAAVGIAGTNMSGAINPASSAAERLVAYLGRAYRWVLQLAGMAPEGRVGQEVTPAVLGFGLPSVSVQTGNGGLSFPTAPAAPPEIEYGNGSGGGGGGGGKSQAEKDREEALQFIEQMMTAEERRAKQIAEAVALREMLIKTYGVEAAVVGQMDQAIQRLRDTQNKATEELEDLADGLAEAFAGAALQGESLRENLANVFAGIANDIFTSGIKEAIMSVLSPSVSQPGGGGFFGKILGGLFGFAQGGVMSAAGAMPLRKYSRGGIAHSPQVAIYGEGKLPEAYVPLPDGRSIPVTMALPNGGEMGVRYVEVPYIARVDADDKGRLVGRIDRARQEAVMGDALTAKRVGSAVPGMVQNYQSRGAN